MPSPAEVLDRLSEPRDGVELLVVAVLAVLLALVVHALVVHLLRRLVGRSPVASAARARTVVPGGWMLPLIALQAAWETRRPACAAWPWSGT